MLLIGFGHIFGLLDQRFTKTKVGRWKGEGRAPSPFHSGVFTRLSGQGERGLKRPGQSNQANIGDLTTDFAEPITGQS